MEIQRFENVTLGEGCVPHAPPSWAPLRADGRRGSFRW